jgi:hypothetical protein
MIESNGRCGYNLTYKLWNSSRVNSSGIRLATSRCSSLRSIPLAPCPTLPAARSAALAGWAVDRCRMIASSARVSYELASAPFALAFIGPANHQRPIFLRRSQALFRNEPFVDVAFDRP